MQETFSFASLDQVYRTSVKPRLWRFQPTQAFSRFKEIIQFEENLLRRRQEDWNRVMFGGNDVVFACFCCHEQFPALRGFCQKYSTQ